MSDKITICANAPVAPALVPVLASHFTVIVCPNFDPLAAGLSGEEVASIRGLLTVGHAAVNSSVLERFPCVVVVAANGVGVDHINISDCTSRGVRVGNTPGVIAPATADLAFGLLLGLARNIVAGDKSMHLFCARVSTHLCA